MKYYYSCPKCGNDECFLATDMEKDRSSALAMFFFLGTLPALLFLSYENQPRVQCGKCKHIVVPPPLPSASAIRLTRWCLAILLFVSLATLFLMGYPEMLSGLTLHPFLLQAETLIADNARVFLFATLALFVLLIPLALISSLIFNMAYRRELRSKYKTKPSTFGFSEETPESKTDSDPQPVGQQE